jgi:S-adenosylmethionine uptake transporter
MTSKAQSEALQFGLLAFFVLSVMDASIKGLAEIYSPVLVSFGRFFAASLVSLTIWFFAGRPQITLTHLKSHSVRGALQAISMVLFSISLVNLRLMEAMTIAFLAPLMIPPLAAILLRERLKARQTIGGLLGFMGALTIVAGANAAPLSGHNTWLGVSTAIGAAFTYALSIVMLKSRAEDDGAVVSGVFSSIVPAIVLSPLLLRWGDDVALVHVPHFLALGLMSAVAMGLLTLAYARVDAQNIAPLEYSAAIWAGLIGWIAFGEIPSALAVIGCVIIIVSSVWANKSLTASSG